MMLGASGALAMKRILFGQSFFSCNTRIARCTKNLAHRYVILCMYLYIYISMHIKKNIFIYKL